MNVCFWMKMEVVKKPAKVSYMLNFPFGNKGMGWWLLFNSAGQ